MTEKEIIPIDSKSFIPVEEIKVNSVKDESNELLFINGTIDIVPFNGMKKGPYKGSDYSKIQFFYPVVYFFDFFVRMMFAVRAQINGNIMHILFEFTLN